MRRAIAGCLAAGLVLGCGAPPPLAPAQPMGPIVDECPRKGGKPSKEGAPIDCDDVPIVEAPALARVRFERIDGNGATGCERLELQAPHRRFAPVVQKRLAELLGCRSCEVTRVYWFSAREALIGVRYSYVDAADLGRPALIARLDTRARLEADAMVLERVELTYLDRDGEEQSGTIDGRCEDGRVSRECVRFVLVPPMR